MKKKICILVASIFFMTLVGFSGITAYAKSSSSRSSSHSSSRSSGSKSSSSPSSSKSSGSSSSSKPSSGSTSTKNSSNTSPSSTKSSSSSSSSNSSKSSSSSSSSSKTSSSSSSSSPKSSSGTTSSSSKNFNGSIPDSYASRSVSNNYYYNSGSRWSNLLSNYMLFRMLTPNNRVYVDSYGNTSYAPAYNGFRSCIADIITFLVILVRKFRKRNR